MYFLKKCLIVFSLCLCLLVSSGILASPVFASVRQQEEVPGQMLYQSRQSLRDNHGQTWQVVLFKRVKNNMVTAIDLRLVGYPDQTEFIHPGSLTISWGTQLRFSAADQFAKEAPAPNVGQFDLKEILPQLPTQRSVLLTLPLKDLEKSTTLEVPTAVLLEWQLMA